MTWSEAVEAEKLTIKPLEWVGDGLSIIDQTLLPQQLARLVIDDVEDLVGAIVRLAVRGAPALGVAGAYGVAIALRQGGREGWSADRVRAAVARIRAARPTAVNLAFGVDRAAARLDQGFDAVLAEAHAVRAEDLAANRRLSEYGADWWNASS